MLYLPGAGGRRAGGGSYLAMGLPAVIAGFVLVHEGDLLATAVQYGVAVMALAALALGGAVRTARHAAQADLMAGAQAGPADLGARFRCPCRYAARLVPADRPVPDCPAFR